LKSLLSVPGMKFSYIGICCRSFFHFSYLLPLLCSFSLFDDFLLSLSLSLTNQCSNAMESVLACASG
jgi:hypothetical protein